MEQLDYSKSSTELDGWFGLATPTFMLTTLTIYLVFVLRVGPNYMQKRAAYELKTFIAVYNVTQVIACIYIVLEIFHITSTKIFKFWLCSFFEPNSREEYIFNRLSYFIFWLKIIELSETVVFVLRKKQNQVSTLHVFHHCSTITLVYVLLKYYRGGAALYPLMLNSNVHIVMYSYYLAAAVCSKNVVNRLTPIKKSITTIQMIQFTLILMQAIVMYRSCIVSPYIVGYYCVVIAVMFYGFYDFYKKAYIQSHKRRVK